MTRRTEFPADIPELVGRLVEAMQALPAGDMRRAAQMAGEALQAALARVDALPAEVERLRARVGELEARP